MKQILIRLSDGRLAYSRPCAEPDEGEAEADYLRRVAERTIAVAARDGVPGFDGAEVVAFVDDEVIPDDPTLRKYRDAWTWTTDEPSIDIDMERARAVALEHLRRERNVELGKLDVEEMKSSGDSQRLSQIRTRKQTLRDMPSAVAADLEAATSLAELEEVRLP